MAEPNNPPPLKRRARKYERLRQPGSALITSVGIGVSIVALIATLGAVIVAIIW
jgi:hypothetical protein